MRDRARPRRRTRTAEQVYRDLLRRIVVGENRPGERLPPERELAPALATSRVTLRQALARSLPAGSA